MAADAAFLDGVDLAPKFRIKLVTDTTIYAVGEDNLARLGQPAEIAATAVFLASDESSFTSGADHYVDGGYTAI